MCRLRMRMCLSLGAASTGHSARRLGSRPIGSRCRATPPFKNSCAVTILVTASSGEYDFEQQRCVLGSGILGMGAFRAIVLKPLRR